MKPRTVTSGLLIATSSTMIIAGFCILFNINILSAMLFTFGTWILIGSIIEVE